MTVLAFDNVSRVYGIGHNACHALRAVTLTVDAGEMVALAGPSGSGKSTLLHLAAGLDLPTSGDVVLLDRALSQSSESVRARRRRSDIGYVFQALNLLPAMTAAENVELPLVLAGRPPALRRQRVAELLHGADLADKADALPDELSGGEQQRVAALRAVAAEPPLVLLDEPTSNLDSVAAGRLVGLLERLNRSLGTTIVVATHDPSVITRFARRITLHDGRVVDDHKE